MKYRPERLSGSVVAQVARYLSADGGLESVDAVHCAEPVRVFGQNVAAGHPRVKLSVISVPVLVARIRDGDGPLTGSAFLRCCSRSGLRWVMSRLAKMLIRATMDAITSMITSAWSQSSLLVLIQESGSAVSFLRTQFLAGVLALAPVASLPCALAWSGGDLAFSAPAGGLPSLRCSGRKGRYGLRRGFTEIGPVGSFPFWGGCTCLGGVCCFGWGCGFRAFRLPRSVGRKL